MFIHELDIPWMQSPFLRHRRKIGSEKDIVLLKKAGVKQIIIDLARGSDVKTDTAAQKVEQRPVEQDATETEKTDTSESVAKPENTGSEHKTAQKPTGKATLNEELKVAKQLQGKIGKLVTQLGDMVRQGRPVSVDSITPVIDEARESLNRNDQALLTMLHLHRQDIKLSDHGFGVFSVVLPLAMRLGCSEEEVNQLGMAALLHDTGWSRLPMHLMGKNKAYTIAEKKLVQQHVSIVENVLNKSPEFPETVKILVSQHHESKDGSGYPNQLSADQIHPLVEILQLADCYDEYIHGLQDKPGMLPANALKIIYQNARNGLYSEEKVSELIHVMGIYPLTSAVRLSNATRAIVVEIDKQKPLLPKVKLIYQADGKPINDAIILDLANQSGDEVIKITEVIDPIDHKEDPLGLLRVSDTSLIS